jgi:hypothetical protein
MKKITLMILVMLAVSLLFTACETRPESVYVTGDEADKTAETVEPIANHILTGIETNDYATFSTDFDDLMRKSITEDAFVKIEKQFGKFGQHESLELLNIEDQGNYLAVNYGVSYADAKMIMRIVVSREALTLVSGLWFK